MGQIFGWGPGSELSDYFSKVLDLNPNGLRPGRQSPDPMCRCSAAILWLLRALGQPVRVCLLPYIRNVNYSAEPSMSQLEHSNLTSILQLHKGHVMTGSEQ